MTQLQMTLENVLLRYSKMCYINCPDTRIQCSHIYTPIHVAHSQPFNKGQLSLTLLFNSYAHAPVYLQELLLPYVRFGCTEKC